MDTLVADLTEAIAAAAAAGTLIDNIDVDPDSIVVENGTRAYEDVLSEQLGKARALHWL